MTLQEKQEKIAKYILDSNNIYEEILWLVEEVTDMLKENGHEIEYAFDYALEED